MTYHPPKISKNVLSLDISEKKLNIMAIVLQNSF